MYRGLEDPNIPRFLPSVKRPQATGHRHLEGAGRARALGFQISNFPCQAIALSVTHSRHRGLCGTAVQVAGKTKCSTRPSGRAAWFSAGQVVVAVQVNQEGKENTWIWKQAHALDCFGGLELIASLAGLKPFTSGLPHPDFSRGKKWSPLPFLSKKTSTVVAVNQSVMMCCNAVGFLQF